MGKIQKKLFGSQWDEVCYRILSKFEQIGLALKQL